jgi:lipopolysaccharide biosynthesis glycosyltransferase
MNGRIPWGDDRGRMGRGAVVFLLNSTYLDAFRTLAHSIRWAIAADTHDIVVLSNDPAALENPLVRSLAHRRILLSRDEIDGLRRIDASKVDPDLRNEVFGKYTFLKFFAFKDFGYSHHIFLDVDMICLKPDFSFEELVLPCDFAAAPTMGSYFLRRDPDLSPAAAAAEVRRRVRKLFRRRYDVTREFNSGVFLVRRPLLSDNSVSNLLAIGAARAVRLEQQITHHFIVTRPGLRFRSLPIGYNFVQGAAAAVGEAEFAALRPQIVFLHFNAKVKPWREDAPDDWLTRLWRAAEAEAEGWTPPPARPDAALRDRAGLPPL